MCSDSVKQHGSLLRQALEVYRVACLLVQGNCLAKHFLNLVLARPAESSLAQLINGGLVVRPCLVRSPKISEVIAQIDQRQCIGRILL